MDFRGQEWRVVLAVEAVPAPGSGVDVTGEFYRSSAHSGIKLLVNVFELETHPTIAITIRCTPFGHNVIL